MRGRGGVAGRTLAAEGACFSEAKERARSAVLEGAAARADNITTMWERLGEIDFESETDRLF